MDRRFILQKKDKYELDDIVIRYIIDKLKNRNFDEVIESTIDKIPAVIMYDRHNYKKFKMIPVGDLDFTRAWLQAMYNSDLMQPLEVPEVLRTREITGRDYRIISGNEVFSTPEYWNYFIKDADTLKLWNNLLYLGSESSTYYEENIRPDRNYVLSSKVDFVSEWRIFVYKDNVLGCFNYLGNPSVFPNEYFIKSVITQLMADGASGYDIHSYPEAYTLDLGVLKDSTTVLIEMHPFVSCGLYGFQDDKLPDMLEAGYNWYVDQIKKSKRT